MIRFTFGSHLEARWQCPKVKSHAFLARISTRTPMFTTCKKCEPRGTKKGYPAKLGGARAPSSNVT